MVEFNRDKIIHDNHIETELTRKRKRSIKEELK